MKERKKNIYLVGVDGGATKSEAAIADKEGKIVLSHKGQALNYHAVGKERFVQNLHDLLGIVIRFTKSGDVFAVFGLAGLDTAKDKKILMSLVRKVTPRSWKIMLLNDTKIVLEAGCQNGNRIVVIAGTGSNVCGENEKGESMRSGGWGFLLADEGSAYGFGRDALKASVRSYDGRGEQTILEECLIRHFKVTNMEEVITKINHIWLRSPEKYKFIIASAALCVEEALRNDDKIAQEIVERGAEELALGVCAVAKRLDITQEKVCICFTGSNFKTPRFLHLLQEKIKRDIPHASFQKLVERPVLGAIRLAKEILKEK